MYEKGVVAVAKAVGGVVSRGVGQTELPAQFASNIPTLTGQAARDAGTFVNDRKRVPRLEEKTAGWPAWVFLVGRIR